MDQDPFELGRIPHHGGQVRGQVYFYPYPFFGQFPLRQEKGLLNYLVKIQNFLLEALVFGKVQQAFDNLCDLMTAPVDKLQPGNKFSWERPLLGLRHEDLGSQGHEPAWTVDTFGDLADES